MYAYRLPLPNSPVLEVRTKGLSDIRLCMRRRRYIMILELGQEMSCDGWPGL